MQIKPKKHAPGRKWYEVYDLSARNYFPHSELELLELMGEEQQLTVSSFSGCARTVALVLPHPSWQEQPWFGAAAGANPQGEENQ